MKEDPLPDKELLWKQYALKVDLYKFYLELVVKFTIFYYATTGAILSFYFSHGNLGVARYALLFPVLMSLASGAIFIYGAKLIRNTRKDLYEIQDQLGLGTAPNMNVLAVLLTVSASVMLLVSVVLTWMFLRE